MMKYSLLRLLVFGACLGLLVLARVPFLLAVVFSAVLSSAVSYLFLRRARDEVVTAIQARVEAQAERAGHREPGTDDEAVEDAQVAAQTAGSDADGGRRGDPVV